MSAPITGRFVLPAVVGTHFLLHEGAIVADFGAGSGFFIPFLSNAVGQTGRVFACEIQRPLVEKLGNDARTRGLQNIDPLWCDLETVGGIKIANDTLDAGILVNTLFQLEDKQIALAEIRRTLIAEGTLHVIDWSESFNGLGPKSDAVVTKDQAVAIFESNGYVFEREYPAGEHHYGLAFRKI